MSELKVKQLYEKVGDEYKKFNPQINLQSILDSVSEKSVAYIFHHYNHFNASWTNTQELTRAQVPPQLRRNNLWLSYTNKEGKKITERFVGTDLDASIYERWIDSEYWEVLDFELLIAGVKQALENMLVNINQYPSFKDFIKKVLTCIFNDKIDPDWLEQLVEEVIQEQLVDLLKEAVEQYLDSDEFKEWLRDSIEDIVGTLIDEYFADIQQALWDQERVIANALARHELAITELQNQINGN